MAISLRPHRHRIMALSGGARHTILVAESMEPLRVVAHRQRPWDPMLARVHSLTLDGMLAAGIGPESSRLLAVRADALLEAAARRRLGRQWEALLQRANRPDTMHDPRLPLPRARIIDAGPDIRQLAALLAVSRPASVRGIALASVLLTDGAGPVHNPRCRLDLGGVVRAAINFLPERPTPASL